MDLITLQQQLGTAEKEIYNESDVETEAKRLAKDKCAVHCSFQAGYFDVE